MPSRIVELSSIIAEKTKVLDEYWSSKGTSTPSFDKDGPVHIAVPQDDQRASPAYSELLDATRELELLITGPTEILMRTSAMNCLSLQAIYRFKIARALPVDKELSFEELSQATGLNLVDLRRLVRHAMCNGIFFEPRTGTVGHTAASRLMAENDLVNDFVGILVEEKFPATARVVDALSQFKGEHAPGQVGFSLAFDTDKGMYEELALHPDRNKRFAGAMNQFAAGIPLGPLISGFPWSELGNATVVDVGGGWGPVSVGLAQAFPNLNLIVQDLASVVAEGPQHIPAQLRDRIAFRPYDIVLEEQPHRGAETYYFRNVFHNWPDAYCVRILRNQIPALKKGARILINEIFSPDPKTLPRSVERSRRSMDLSMMAFFGSHEHDVEEWRDLVKEADERFVVKRVAQLPGDASCLLEVEWQG